MASNFDAAIAELKETTNAVEKNMLLQKYGLIDPKLTEWEQIIVRMEQQQIAAKGFSDLEVSVNAPGRTC